jgi:hypothetical protein
MNFRNLAWVFPTAIALIGASRIGNPRDPMTLTDVVLNGFALGYCVWIGWMARGEQEAA